MTPCSNRVRRSWGHQHLCALVGTTDNNCCLNNDSSGTEKTREEEEDHEDTKVVGLTQGKSGTLLVTILGEKQERLLNIMVTLVSSKCSLETLETRIISKTGPREGAGRGEEDIPDHGY